MAEGLKSALLDTHHLLFVLERGVSAVAVVVLCRWLHRAQCLSDERDGVSGEDGRRRMQMLSQLMA